MRRAFLALTLLPFVLHAAAPERIALWNGRDLAGWSVFTASPETAPVWTARDGVLRLEAHSRGYVRTERSFANYRLHFEWRWPVPPSAVSAPRRNSGVILHLTGPDRLWPAGYEFQLLTGLAGQLVAITHDLPGGQPHPKDGLKRLQPLAAPSEKPLGEWNTAEVIARGDTLELTVNGVLQNRATALPAHSGALALQIEGAPIEFRALWLEPL